MKRVLAFICGLVLSTGFAFAQNQSNPAIVGGTAAYNSSPPTCTNGNWCTMQTDVNGNLKIVGGSGSASTQIQGAVNITPTDCSGTITTGGTAQNLFSAQAGLHGFTIMNMSTSSMWISFTGTASTSGSAGSFFLAPAATGVTGGSYSTPLGFGVNTAVSIVSGTTGAVFSCVRW